MALIEINGRTHHFTRVQEVRRVRPGHFVVIVTNGSFHIEGGKAAGGSARDWFLSANDSNIFGGNSLNATSLVDALNLLENA